MAVAIRSVSWDDPAGLALRVAQRVELTERYGGVTAYLRSPASGVWRDEGGEEARDEVVMVEVMVGKLQRQSWAEYRRVLEGRFRQAELVVRALRIDRL